MNPVSGLGALVAAYDAVLIDVWGVLHEGGPAYPAALDCLSRLRAADKSVVLVSNAARRLDGLRAELLASGVTPDLYHGLVASGELTWRALAAGEIDFARGGDGFLFGPERSRGLCADLPQTWCDEPEAAQFVLTTGSPQGNPPTAEAWDPWLERMAERALPMICANPDQVAIRQGRLGVSAGAIARRYRDLGVAPVMFFGKPDPAVFTHAAGLLPGLGSQRLLVVGDGLATDITGANAAGLDSLLVTGGIHAAELGAANNEDIVALAAQYDAFPTFFARELCW